ncbi:onanonoxo-7-onima-8-eninoihtemlysoneda [Sphaerosporella brunnea]|uniref:Onanonoxo-7-onima-8-eninoihtemlysoneda n=1 Tax=Sphaerosporella brunnea TaxID=1250544 RepID=A0A5J5EKX9_9PEZI|nr:onanonoxo-7-onima-8-eninoihtemlysoneda [Sphaerosporella brunnea]
MRFPANVTSSPLSRSLRVFQVYGANTDVGKTIVSTLLCKALRRRSQTDGVWYLKPVSTGAQQDADDLHITRFVKGVETKCFWQFKEPISPHLAAPQTPDHSDGSLLSKVREHISAINRLGTVLLETAGGVHSPAPSGTSQADLYRPLRLPIILVADSNLGGISTSISAFESLHTRGYDVEQVVVFANEKYKNDGYLLPYFSRYGIPLTVLPPPPPKSGPSDEAAMSEYYESTAEKLGATIESLENRHAARIANVRSMSGRAFSKIWYPFTQHEEISANSIQAIDSAHDDFFQTYTPSHDTSSSQMLKPKFDGSASWWTQGLGHSNPDLTLAAAHAAGRYGHVMFPGSIHAPALELAELLLDKIGNGRLSRVFYSDNGSTGAEVALKMALRASRLRYGWSPNEKVDIIGLKGAYHGDTIGVMDCADPGAFNKEVEWYSGRGFWFDFPKVGMKDGAWKINMPQEMGGSEIKFDNLASIFDVEKREGGVVGEQYANYIRGELKRAIKDEGKKFGAVMIEPLILGSGGMLFADPLFQRTLVNVVRNTPGLFPEFSEDVSSPDSWSGVPIVFDEVFTGLHRLGRVSSASFLGVDADVSIHAKLLTGGLLPLCTTLASESIFKQFLHKDKTMALLHGHSYTAHAVGCSVAKKSVETILELDQAGEWKAAKADWASQEGVEMDVWSQWRQSFVSEVSHLPQVEGTFALGTVLAVTLRDDKTTGYTSTAAGGLLADLKSNGVDARTLGNVVYVMTSLTSKQETVRALEDIIMESLRAM